MRGHQLSTLVAQADSRRVDVNQLLLQGVGVGSGHRGRVLLLRIHKLVSPLDKYRLLNMKPLTADLSEAVLP